jgi:hypothetical protein
MDRSRLELEEYAAERFTRDLRAARTSGVWTETLLGSTAVATALAFVAETEEGKSNRGPAPDFFSAQAGYDFGKQWCSIFVGGAWIRACERLTYLTREPWKLDSKKSSGAVRSWHYNREKDAAYTFEDVIEGRVKPQIGWQYVRVRDPEDRDKAVAGSSSQGHTGLVIRVDDDGTVHTIEGNTIEKGESANGGGVFIKTIQIKDTRLVGFARPLASH